MKRIRITNKTKRDGETSSLEAKNLSVVKDKDTLEQHAMQLHSINAEGLQRLMMLMQGSHWLNAVKNAGKEDEEKDGGKF